MSIDPRGINVIRVGAGLLLKAAPCGLEQVEKAWKQSGGKAYGMKLSTFVDHMEHAGFRFNADGGVTALPDQPLATDTLPLVERRRRSRGAA